MSLVANGTISHVGSVSIFASSLNATANGGIDMFTNVSQLNVVNSGANGVFIDNIGNVNITSLNGGSGDVTLVNTGTVTNGGAIIAPNGAVTVVASGPMTIGGTVTASSDLILETIDTAANDTLTVTAVVQSTNGDVYLIAGGEDVALSGAAISGQHVGIAAPGGTVRAQLLTNPTIDANSLTVQAGNTINLGPATLTLHNGTPTLASQQFGDAAMLSAFSTVGGTIPTSSVANAAFVAPTVTLGSIDFFGDYMYLKANTLNLNQNIFPYVPGSEASPVPNQNFIAQMEPYTNGQNIVVEDVMPSIQAGTTYYTNADHFQKFQGTSLFVGSSLYTGGVAIGQSGGAVNIGGQNFLAATSGNVSGIGNIVSTGLVAVVGAAPPPTTTTTTTTGGVTTVVQQTTTTTDPTDPGGTTITDETLDSNLPSDEETDPTAGGEIDFVAILEQAPLVDGQIEVNGTVLTCQ